MKNNRRHIIKKRIHEIDATKNYSGEASPYWDAVFDQQDLRNKELKAQEDALANPDVLAEEDSLYHRPLTPEGELQMQAVHETFVDLTIQQQRIVRLSLEGVWSDKDGQRVFTEQAIADELGIARTTVQDALNRIKTKIRRRYEKLKAIRD